MKTKLFTFALPMALAAVLCLFSAPALAQSDRSTDQGFEVSIGVGASAGELQGLAASTENLEAAALLSPTDVATWYSRGYFGNVRSDRQFFVVGRVTPIGFSDTEEVLKTLDGKKGMDKLRAFDLAAQIQEASGFRTIFLKTLTPSGYSFSRISDLARATTAAAAAVGEDAGADLAYCVGVWNAMFQVPRSAISRPGR
jgi:hypothetical protein